MQPFVEKTGMEKHTENSRFFQAKSIEKRIKNADNKRKTQIIRQALQFAFYRISGNQSVFQGLSHRIIENIVPGGGQGGE